jgi:hypothetical protein
MIVPRIPSFHFSIIPIVDEAEKAQKRFDLLIDI